MGKIKLPSNFSLERYGVSVRLANEDDSEFILSLRTNEKLSRFIHSTDNDLEKQREWMRNYKIREANGEDYYFIYSYQGVPYGVNRIYDIKDDRGTGGSWVCRLGTDVAQVMPTLLIQKEIYFEELGFEIEYFDVRKENKLTHHVHKMTGAKIVSESDIDYFYELTKADYYKNRPRVLKMLGFTQD